MIASCQLRRPVGRAEASRGKSMDSIRWRVSSAPPASAVKHAKDPSNSPGSPRGNRAWTSAVEGVAVPMEVNLG